MELIILIALIVLVVQVQLLLSKTQVSISRRGKKVFVDTSALMDGRIMVIASSGFIPNQLVIPKSVVAELQMLADQADSEKRMRARDGLDGVAQLQQLSSVQVTILDDEKIAEGGVDDRLLQLAKKYNGDICTVDFNLNKVAKVHKIGVLNINDLAQSIRMAFLPGERTRVTVTHKGQDPTQGVGYLADGTMTVVDQAAKFIGKEVEIEVIRSLQTSAGRMIFSKLVHSAAQAERIKAKEKAVTRTLSKNNPGRTTQRSSQANKSNHKQSNEDRLIELVNNKDS